MYLSVFIQKIQNKIQCWWMTYATIFIYTTIVRFYKLVEGRLRNKFFPIDIKLLFEYSMYLSCLQLAKYIHVYSQTM